MYLGRLSFLFGLFPYLCIQIIAKQPQLSSKVLQQLVNNHAQKFDEFKEKNKKRYSNPSEQLYRNLVFFKNQKTVAEHNLDAQKTYTMQLNQFSDMDEEQFRLTYANLIISNNEIRAFAQTASEKVRLQKEDCFCKVQNQFKQLQINAKIKSKTEAVFKNNLEYLLAKKIGFEKKEQQYLNFAKELLNLSEDEYEVIQQKIDPQRQMYKKEYDENSHLPSFIPPTISDLFNFKEKLTFPNQLPNDTPVPQTLSSPNTPIDNSEGNDQGQQPTDNLKKNKQKQPRLLLENDLSQYNSNWIDLVGEARNQGLCGACYAFAAVQNLESILAIYAFGAHIQLSVQQVIDCAGSTNLTVGCDGGYLQGPFVYLKNYGITTSYSYPYTSGVTGQAGNCKTTEGFFKISSYKALPFRDCMALRKTLKKKPVSTAIASYRLQFYKSGVFTDCNSYLDHAVLVVGYQYQKGWLIKNSWGSSWGQNGFAWLADGNSCSLCDYAMVPKIDLQPPSNP